MSLARPSQRSARRATLSIGPAGIGAEPGSGVLRGLSGSLSPQHALRTKVLRERERSNEGSVHGDAGGAAKAKPATKPANKGSTRTQEMQFAFGSRVMKPKAGLAAVESRLGARMTSTSGPIVADPAVVARGRRDRSRSRHEPHDGKDAKAPASREAEAGAPKSQPEDKGVADTGVKSRLERDKQGGREDGSAVGGSGTQRGGGQASKHVEADGESEPSAKWSEADEAALRSAEEETRREAEEAIAAVEAQAATSLARTAEMQAGVDEIIRKLKARQ